jgi:circadian clock protein KaiC
MTTLAATPVIENTLPKVMTGVQGLDEITGGGLPQGRPTLVCGSAGSGKTLLAMEFLVRGATEFGEPGLFMAFEETAPELAQNVRSLGFDLEQLVREKKLVLDHVRVERSEIDETGEYDLGGLFLRLGHAIDSIGAKRVVLDTVESLFSAFTNEAILRAELRRLFGWLKSKGVSAIITAERGDGNLTRRGLEEYVSDCVILLDHRVADQISTRRLRVVKYRGTNHGMNEYPFLIDETGFTVLPITSLGLQHKVSNERVSTGVARLDTMLGEGYYRGSSILLSGTAGSGKSSLAAHFAAATCRRGERCLYFALEESADQIIRNMRSISVDLEPAVERGQLKFHCTRAEAYGLETHLAVLHKLIRDFKPEAVIIDPVTCLTRGGTVREAAAMLTRVIDFLKTEGITAVLTSLTSGGAALERTEIEVSSLVDTWLLLRDIELGGERNRAMYVLKSRGMAHSNQIQEFVITAHGVDLLDAYLGPEGVLTGSMRLSQEAREREKALARRQETERRERERQRKREALEARIAAMRKEFEAEDEEAAALQIDAQTREEQSAEERNAMARSRKADAA